ncbi:MAG: hypothetical protein ACO3NK_09165 [Prochlorotrichaceae cyanobacterium]|jgi:hypothetical protein
MLEVQVSKQDLKPSPTDFNRAGVEPHATARRTRIKDAALSVNVLGAIVLFGYSKE